MKEDISFRAPPASLVMQVLFLAACLVVVCLCYVGLTMASGIERMILLISSLFPLLISIAAMLRLLAVGSRQIRLAGPLLIHRQLFKNYTVSLADIARIEALKGRDGQVVTIRILWSGTPFYVDRGAIAGFEEFVGALERRAVQAELSYVTEFSPSL